MPVTVASTTCRIPSPPARSPFDTLRDAVADLLSGHDPSWEAQAACRGVDPAVFFPVEALPAPERKKALAVVERFCGACPVRGHCLAAAVVRSEVGLWAGTDERARAALAQRLRHSGVTLPGDGATVVALPAARHRPIPPPKHDRLASAAVPATAPTAVRATDPAVGPAAHPDLSSRSAPGEPTPPSPVPDLVRLAADTPLGGRWALLVRLDAVDDDTLAGALDDARRRTAIEVVARRRSDGTVDVFARQAAA